MWVVLATLEDDVWILRAESRFYITIYLMNTYIHRTQLFPSLAIWRPTLKTSLGCRGLSPYTADSWFEVLWNADWSRQWKTLEHVICECPTLSVVKEETQPLNNTGGADHSHTRHKFPRWLLDVWTRRGEKDLSNLDLSTRQRHDESLVVPRFCELIEPKERHSARSDGDPHAERSHEVMTSTLSSLQTPQEDF